MTYREHSAQLAQHLARLCSTRGSRILEQAELDVALIGRHGTIRLLQEAMMVATGRDTINRADKTASTARTTLAQAMKDPVMVLHQAIDSYPNLHPGSALTAVRSTDLKSITARLWHQVARAAVFARHDLGTDRHGYTGEYRWSLVADVAAIAPVLQELDHQLLAAAQRIHGDAHPTVAALAHATRHSPVTMLATDADAVARGGRLPDLTALQLPPAFAGLIQVTSTAALLEAQRRLPVQLATVGEVRPDVVARTALGQARVLLRTAELLERHEQPRGSSALARDLARQLGEIQPEPSDVTSLMLGDSTPLAQTNAMWQYLRDQQPQELRLRRQDLLALRALVHQGPVVVEELSRTADAQLTSGRWLISYSEGSAYTWDRYRYYDDEPRLVAALAKVRANFPASELALAPRATVESARITLARSPRRKVTRAARPDTPDKAVIPPAAKETRGHTIAL